MSWARGLLPNRVYDWVDVGVERGGGAGGGRGERGGEVGRDGVVGWA